MKTRPLVLLLMSLPLAGCFTLRETAFPRIVYRAEPSIATNITIAVRGFTATLTDYKIVDGYQTVFYNGGPGWYGYGGVATAHSTSVVPYVRPSDAFLEQAKNRLEGVGFNIMAQRPDYVVEARFTGPETTAEDTWTAAAWIICSLFTCDHGAQTWRARLKIHDNRTGRLVLSRDYEQKYMATGFSPIPIFGISCYERTSDTYMQCWCLSALTDQMSVDTAEFLTSRK